MRIIHSWRTQSDTWLGYRRRRGSRAMRKEWADRGTVTEVASTQTSRRRYATMWMRAAVRPRRRRRRRSVVIVQRVFDCDFSAWVCVCVCEEMVTPPQDSGGSGASGARQPDSSYRSPGLRGLNTTSLFRAVNPELFIRPASEHTPVPNAHTLQSGLHPSLTHTHYSSFTAANTVIHCDTGDPRHTLASQNHYYDTYRVRSYDKSFLWGGKSWLSD